SLICRACLDAAPVMINIFDNAPGLGISIADMITQCTPYEISKGDGFPENICDSCLHCARSAFDIRQAIEKSHQKILQLKNREVLTANLRQDVCSPEIKKPHKCTYCQKEFKKKWILQEHMRGKHTGERPYKCTQCSSSFSYVSSLKSHITFLHSEERPYKCSQCSKSFKKSCHLHRHIQTHTGERPFKCSQCSKSFPNNRNLQLHIRTHTGERPYKCPQCPQSFTQKSNLKPHILTHTG
ncbi:hypothetical protein KR059_003098, partial [Drosophila kikkawai]